ncbi:DUF547 domain-containing protein [Flavobacterium sp.]|uniref:DUF547 domain-containing protein n=1 Tax=Flavobacterium sp. TaxID=239 RepID=UPI00286DBDF9|nr:DUF547 domain-containing protein [Flavobacterium sp.]
MKISKKSQITFLFLLFSFLVNANTVEVFFQKSDYFFKLYVFKNKVDYAAIKKDPSLLNEIVAISADLDLSVLEKNSYKAFWINAYNIMVIKGIVSNYPTSSVQEIKGFFDKKVYKIGGEEITLTNIERYKLKSILKDSFLNFVLVCAANGCPPLINQAYMPDMIDQQLENQAKTSINNPNFIRVNKKAKVVEISEIFDWYRQDFINQDERIIDFINKYRTEKIDNTYTIEYYKYDWTLNTKI